jgi:hypothetical protein
LADRDPADLLRENAYLKQRNAQLQSDILDLSAEAERLRRLQDRLHGRAAIQNPDAPAGGQQYPSRKPACPDGGAPSEVSEIQASTVSEEEAGVMDDANASEYAITRAPVDYFHVGGYRYTSLKEAIAEAKRQRGIP